MLHLMILLLCLRPCSLLKLRERKKSELLMDVFCMSLLSSPLRLSLVSVVFDFNASLNDFAPVSPLLFTVDVMRMEKS